VFHLNVTSVSSGCCRCFICMFQVFQVSKQMLLVFHLDVAKSAQLHPVLENPHSYSKIYVSRKAKMNYNLGQMVLGCLEHSHMAQ
jgi:hypothetical protein